MTECYRRFNNGTYLLTCNLNKGHSFRHMDGEESWEVDEGFDDEYTGAPIKYDPDRVRPEPVYVPFVAPTMTDMMVTPESIGPYLKANPPPIDNPRQTIAERLAARKALNAALKV